MAKGSDTTGSAVEQSEHQEDLSIEEAFFSSGLWLPIIDPECLSRVLGRVGSRERPPL